MPKVPSKKTDVAPPPDESEAAATRKSSRLRGKALDVPANAKAPRKRAAASREDDHSNGSDAGEAVAAKGSKNDANESKKQGRRRKRALTSGEAPDVAKKPKQAQGQRASKHNKPHLQHNDAVEDALESGLQALEVSSKKGKSTGYTANLDESDEDVTMLEDLVPTGAVEEDGGASDEDATSSYVTDRRSDPGSGSEGDSGSEGSESESVEGDVGDGGKASSAAATGRKVGKAAVKQLLSAVPAIDVSSGDDIPVSSSKAKGKAPARVRVRKDDTDSGEERINGLQPTLARNKGTAKKAADKTPGTPRQTTGAASKTNGATSEATESSVASKTPAAGASSKTADNASETSEAIAAASQAAATAGRVAAAKKTTAGASKKTGDASASSTTGAASKTTAGASKKTGGASASSATGAVSKTTGGASKKTGGASASSMTGAASKTTSASSKTAGGATSGASKTTSASSKTAGGATSGASKTTSASSKTAGGATSGASKTTSASSNYGEAQAEDLGGTGRGAGEEEESSRGAEEHDGDPGTGSDNSEPSDASDDGMSVAPPMPATGLWPESTNLVLLDGSKALAGLTEQRPGVREVITEANTRQLPRVLCLNHCLPSATLLEDLSREALILAADARGEDDIAARLRAEKPYAKLMGSITRARATTFRSETAKKRAEVDFYALYRFDKLQTKEKIADAVADMFRPNNPMTFAFSGDPALGSYNAQEPFCHEAVIAVLQLIISNKKRYDAFPDEFFTSSIEEGDEADEREIPIAMVAYAATLVAASLKEYQTGVKVPANFTVDAYAGLYKTLMDELHRARAVNLTGFHAVTHFLYLSAKGLVVEDEEDPSLVQESKALMASAIDFAAVGSTLKLKRRQ
ncbi:hypothetical protein FA95DRAFT_1612895 [Auriscalpium vulgare]|uniref:Uncharacterized protein n=1 Tax=Auriscalpium vulgare TaxID=40419 RepID=A0ACB8R553_9AGAM|nr:hypothetical protein FA95DRAFT_1612895 [Auriscalpium vulgare]